MSYGSIVAVIVLILVIVLAVIGKIDMMSAGLFGALAVAILLSGYAIRGHVGP